MAVIVITAKKLLTDGISAGSEEPRIIQSDGNLM